MRAITMTGDHIKASVQGPNADDLFFFVVGFIDYTFPTDRGVHHQTGFAYEIVRRNGSPIKITDGSISTSELALREFPAGIGRYAD